MRNFEIVCASKRRKKPVGYLSYDETKGEATIAIAKDAKIGHVPAMFNYYLEQGEYTVDARWTRMWVDERIPPESRHNINEILKTVGLKEYDPYALLFHTQGRSSQDEFYLREVINCDGGSASDIGRAKDGGSANDIGRAKDGGSAESSRYEYVVLSLRKDAGRMLAQARFDAGLTQKELAYKTGIQQSTISKIEDGKANPTLETIACLADALGLRASLVLERND